MKTDRITEWVVAALVALAFFGVLGAISTREADAQVLRVLTPVQGGTGISTSTAGDIGTCLKVVDDSPFRYELGTCGAGSSSTGLSTTTPWTNGYLAYVTGDGTVGSVATGTLTTNATGLEFDATRALVGGSAVLSISSGYIIPLIASTTEWATAYASTTALTPAYIQGLWSETVTGLDYASGVLSLTSGYNIPLNASTTEWSIAYASTTALTPSYLRGLFSNTATGLTYNSSTGATTLTAGYNIPLTASTTEWEAAYASTTALTPAYIRGLFSGTSPISYNSGTGAFSLGIVPIVNGGTGTSTAPSLGQLLMGNAVGGYNLVSTSSLGIAGGTPGGLDEQVQFNNGGSFGGSGLYWSNTGAGDLYTDTDINSIYLSVDDNFIFEINGGDSQIALDTTSVVISAPTTTIFDTYNTNLYQYGAPGSRLGIFDFNSIATTDKTFTFPNLTGTIALTGADQTVSFGTTTLSVLTATSTRVLSVLEIPNGTGPVANDPGEIAHDTSDNQLILDDFVVGKGVDTIWRTTIASTSPAFINAGLLKVPTELDGYTMTAIRCSVQGGTSKVIAVEDESANSTEDITCLTSVTSDDGSITNASVTAAEEMYIDFGATSGSVDYVSITVFGTWTRE